VFEHKGEAVNRDAENSIREVNNLRCSASDIGITGSRMAR
jgi:hypothetical protein